MDIAAGNKEVSRVLEGAMLAKDAGVPYRDTADCDGNPNVLSRSMRHPDPRACFLAAPTERLLPLPPLRPRTWQRLKAKARLRLVASADPAEQSRARPTGRHLNGR